MKTVLLAGAALAAIVSTPAGASSVVTADRNLDVTGGRYVEHPVIFIDDGGHITSTGDAYGDIVAVRADPLANVTVLEHVDAVVKGGLLIKGPSAAQ